MTEPPAKYGGKESPPQPPLSTGPVDVPYNVSPNGTDETDKLTNLREYHELVKRVMAIADKEIIEEVARVLAAHVGYYQRRYGVVPIEKTLASLHAESPTDEQIADLAQGMQTLVAVLTLATGVADDQDG